MQSQNTSVSCSLSSSSATCESFLHVSVVDVEPFEPPTQSRSFVLPDGATENWSCTSLYLSGFTNASCLHGEWCTRADSSVVLIVRSHVVDVDCCAAYLEMKSTVASSSVGASWGVMRALQYVCHWFVHQWTGTTSIFLTTNLEKPRRVYVSPLKSERTSM